MPMVPLHLSLLVCAIHHSSSRSYPCAIIRPLFKKQTLDPDNPGFYRPVSNLSFVFKLVERIVDATVSEDVNKCRLLPAYQLAYRPYHATETAVNCDLNDMINVIDQGHVGALMLLHMSA